MQQSRSSPHISVRMKPGASVPVEGHLPQSEDLWTYIVSDIVHYKYAKKVSRDVDVHLSPYKSLFHDKRHRFAM